MALTALGAPAEESGRSFLRPRKLCAEDGRRQPTRAEVGSFVTFLTQRFGLSLRNFAKCTPSQEADGSTGQSQTSSRRRRRQISARVRIHLTTMFSFKNGRFFGGANTQNAPLLQTSSMNPTFPFPLCIWGSL